jgi:hypothetical protein
MSDGEDTDVDEQQDAGRSVKENLKTGCPSPVEHDDERLVSNLAVQDSSPLPNLLPLHSCGDSGGTLPNKPTKDNLIGDMQNQQEEHAVREVAHKQPSLDSRSSTPRMHESCGEMAEFVVDLDEVTPPLATSPTLLMSLGNQPEIGLFQQDEEQIQLDFDTLMLGCPETDWEVQLPADDDIPDEEIDVGKWNYAAFPCYVQPIPCSAPVKLKVTYPKRCTTI